MTDCDNCCDPSHQAHDCADCGEPTCLSDGSDGERCWECLEAGDTVSRAAFLADPARYVLAAETRGPIRVVGEDGRTRLTLSAPLARDEEERGMDVFEFEGVRLTEAKVREVLGWVAEPWRAAPSPLAWRAGKPCFWLPEPNESLSLTPALIEALRNWADPWREVRRDEVGPGERMRNGGVALELSEVVEGRRVWADARHDGRIAWIDREGTVEVRRPRRPALTLRDVEPGKRFESGPWAECRRTRTGYVREMDWTQWVPGESGALKWDAPVTLVEDDQ